MAKLSEIAPKKPLFEGYSKTSQEEKENLAQQEKEIKIIGFAELENGDDSYGVVLYNTNDETKSMTASQIQLKRLKQALENIGLNEARSTDMEKYFSEPVEVVFKQIQSQSSKNKYYVFE